MNDRGMKKWAPYKSLPEHDPKIIEIQKERKKIEKPLISMEIAQEINDILQNYHHQLVRIKYFQNGKIIFVNATIKKIDLTQQKLVLETKKCLEFRNILYIENV